MKTNMSIFILLKVALLTIILSTNLYALKLTKNSVKEFLSNLEKSFNELDIVAIDKMISNDANISITRLKGRSIIVSKKSYVHAFKRIISWSKDYSFVISKVSIDIKDNKSFVSYVLDQSVSLSNMSISSITNVQLEIEPINNKFLITNMYGDITHIDKQPKGKQ